MDYNSKCGLLREWKLMLVLLVLSTGAIGRTDAILTEGHNGTETVKRDVAQRRDHSFNSDGTVNYHGSGSGHDSGDLVPPGVHSGPGPVRGLSNSYGEPIPADSYGLPPRDTYGPPAPKPVYGPPKIPARPPSPKIRYGPPKVHFGSPPKFSFGSLKPRLPSRPKPVYGPPSSFSHGTPLSPITSIKTQYGPPTAPSITYGTPLTPSVSYGPPSKPSHAGLPSPPKITYDGWVPMPGLVSQAPSTSYGPPSGVGADFAGHHHPPSDSYGPPPSISYGPPSKPVSSFSFSSLSFGSKPSISHKPSLSFGPPSKPSFSYGPPALSPSYGVPLQPSTSYGPPAPSKPIFVSAKPPSISYGPPKTPSISYGPPKPPSISYGPPKPPSISYGPPKTPSISYGPPKPPSISYGPPKPPSPSYGPPKPPSTSYGPPKTPSVSYGPPSGPPSFSKPPPQTYGPPKPPSTSYGTPHSSVSFSFSNPSTFYGAPQPSAPAQVPEPPSSTYGGPPPLPPAPDTSYGPPTALPVSGGAQLDLSLPAPAVSYGAPLPVAPSGPQQINLAPPAPAVLPVSVEYGPPQPVITSGLPVVYGTPLLPTENPDFAAHPGTSTQLPLMQPKQPVKFRPPVPVGLISSIGAKWGNANAWGGNAQAHKFHGNTYIPPAVPDPDPGTQSHKGTDLVVPPPSGPSITYGTPDTGAAHAHHSDTADLNPPPSPPSISPPTSYQSVATNFNPPSYGGVENIPVKGRHGSYTLQIQPAGGNPEDSVRHQDVLSNGLLQDILTAIENPVASSTPHQFGGHDHGGNEIGHQVIGQLGLGSVQQSPSVEIPYGGDLQHASSNNILSYEKPDNSTIGALKPRPFAETPAEPSTSDEGQVSRYLSDSQVALYFNTRHDDNGQEGVSDVVLVQMDNAKLPLGGSREGLVSYTVDNAQTKNGTQVGTNAPSASN